MPNYQQQPQEQPQRAAAEPSQRLADKAQQAAEQAKSSALERVRDAREMAEHGLEERRQQAAQRIRRFGNTLRSTRDLNPDDEFMAQLLDGATSRVERVADYVAEADFRQMTQDVEGFARNRPAWFFGGAFLAGLALGRFAKAVTGSAAQSMSGGTEGGFGRDEDSYELSTEDLEYPSRVGSGYPSQSSTGSGPGGGAALSGASGTSGGVASASYGTGGSSGSSAAPGASQSSGTSQAASPSRSPGASGSAASPSSGAATGAPRTGGTPSQTGTPRGGSSSGGSGGAGTP